MKKITILFRLFALVVGLSCALGVSAYDFESGGLYYKITGTRTVEVTSGSPTYSGSVTIPSMTSNAGTVYQVTGIGQAAFNGCKGLTSVTIPNSVTTIGKMAFGNCSALTSVTIPNSVTSISEYAFFSCSNLTSLTIPNSVTSISNYTFYYCTGLTTVTIPNSVTSIGEYAFYGCTGLTSVTIGNSVTTIDMCAFYGCTGLTSVMIPNSVTTVGNTAFATCSGLTSVVIGSSVTSIGGSAFASCTGLTSITIPNSVTTINDNAFGGCKGLTSISIGNSVTTIGSSAFNSCTGLTSVIIPNSVTTIGDYAFRYCTGLKRVVIGSGVESIGDYAFASYDLSTVVCLATTPPTIKSTTFKLDETPGTIHIETKFYVPKGCLNAYQAADYWKNKSIQELAHDFEVNGIYYTITGDRTVEVAKNPLYSGSVNIPAMTSYNGTVYQVTSIAVGAFSECSDLTSVTIPNSVTSIGMLAFAFCSSLSSVTIPQSVTSIGIIAFGGCSGLTSISVASGNTVYDSRNNCNAIIETARNTLIAGCKTTVIPNTVTAIEGAFYYCADMTSVTIPNSVTSISGSSFTGCTGLTSVTIPNSVTSIGGSAFYGCTALTSVTIGSGVTSIGVSGDGYTIIVFNVFGACPNLTSVICLATTPPEIHYAFDDDTYSAATLFVPAASKDAYQVADGWKNFTNIRVVPYDFMVNGICYKITGTNTVEVCENPAPYSGNINIPSTVTYGGKTYRVTGIGTYAFYDCDGLTGVTIPNSVTSIGDAAFTGCDNLTTVTIPNSVTRIGWYAFAYCNGMTSVTIGSGVTTIDDNAFAGCPALRSVTCLATTPPTLGEDVFYSDTYETAALKVPAASLNAYKTANGWRNFLHIIANKRGDINGDGSINVADVTALIQFILTSTPVDLSIADMDDSGTINVADVTALIRLILNS